VIDYWVFALLAPVFFAVGNVIDNHVLHSRLRDPVSYNILTTWPSLPFAAAIFLFWRVSFAFNAWFVAGTIGFVFTFLFIMYTTAMMKEQGTNVVSVLYTGPLFVAVLAAVFLGERLDTVDYAGIVLIVASAFLVLYRRFDSKNRALGIMLVYALLSSSARIVAKSALESVDLWSYLFWFLVGGGIGSVVLAILWSRRFSVAWRQLDARTTSLLIATSTISTFGLILLYAAISLGAVSIASGLAAVQPTIVFLLTAVLVHFRPGAVPSERVSGRWADMRKIGAVLLIILGVLALTEA